MFRRLEDLTLEEKKEKLANLERCKNIENSEMGLKLRNRLIKEIDVCTSTFTVKNAQGLKNEFIQNEKIKKLRSSLIKDEVGTVALLFVFNCFLLFFISLSYKDSGSILDIGVLVSSFLGVVFISLLITSIDSFLTLMNKKFVKSQKGVVYRKYIEEDSISGRKKVRHYVDVVFPLENAIIHRVICKNDYSSFYVDLPVFVVSFDNKKAYAVKI